MGHVAPSALIDALREALTMEMRTCKVCGETTEWSGEFYPTLKGKPQGCVCRKCKFKAGVASIRAKRADPVFRVADNERSRVAMDKILKSNPEFKARQAAKSRVYNTNRLATDPEFKAAGLLRSGKADKIARRQDPEFRKAEAEAAKRYRIKHPYELSVFRMTRRTSENQRTPSWLNTEDRQLIGAKYAMAKWLSQIVGVAYHVDHVIPLRGKFVSGLHVPGNLAVIQGLDNLRKHNKWAP